MSLMGAENHFFHSFIDSPVRFYDLKKEEKEEENKVHQDYEE